MTNKPLQITTPVGRLIGGSLYEPKTTDYDGKPLVIKSGPNQGKPTQSYTFGVAIPKNPGETHWSQHPFFAPIWALGHAAFPAGEAQRSDFAWKITDGDSQMPNKRGRKPCDMEGHKGHWIIWFSSASAPRVFNRDGSQQLTEPGAVKPGYFVQVFGNVIDNKPSASPGIYVNHSMVALAAYGEEIVTGPDVSAAGFGQGVALPPGASMTPPAGSFNPAPPPPVVHGAPAAPPPPLIPNLAVAPLVPPPAPAASAAPARVMTAAANGHTYEQLRHIGWTDAALIAQGMMLAPAAPVPPPLMGGSVAMPAPPAPIAVAPPPLVVIPDSAILNVPAPPVKMIEGQPISVWYSQGWTDAMLIQHGKMAA